MSVIAEIIDTLENKIGKLFTKINSLEQNNQDLKTELSNAAAIIQNLVKSKN
jgi:chaperonin cofactor prefoldin